MAGTLIGIGIGIGIGISVVIVQVLNLWPVAFSFGRQEIVLSPSLSLGDVLWVASIVVLVAGLASLQPAWKAARMDPITALRHV
ncbi:MAG: hypothetical protein LC667_01925 [Thioalkalivibrio sp.]|nr:hypothetical protein [Thioalkalivibrio sp.]